MRENEAVKIVGGQYDGCKGTFVKTDGSQSVVRLKGGGMIKTSSNFVKRDK